MKLLWILAFLILAPLSHAGSVQEHTDGSAASTFSATTPSFWWVSRGDGTAITSDGREAFPVGGPHNYNDTADKFFLVPAGGTVAAIRVNVSANANDADGDPDHQVCFAPTGQTCGCGSCCTVTISLQGTGDFSNTCSASIAAGDQRRIRIDENGADVEDSITISSIAIKIEPD